MKATFVERLVITALIAGLALLNSGPAYAAADGNCGSAASAPAVPGTANEAEPRPCDSEPANESSAQPPPMPDFEPPVDSVPETGAPTEPPAEPPPQPQQ